jgi:MerR family transcriptional regulator, light-induced transcriptional regulator
MDPIDRYLELALTPDTVGLARLFETQVAAEGAAATYDRLVQPALELLGARWERDEITVADEHLVTALTEQLLAGVGDRRGGGPTAVVACTPGNEHRLGALIAADGLRRAGWQPRLLPPATSYAGIVRACEEGRARLLALSVGMDDELAVLDGELRRLRAAIGRTTPILVGGGAVRRRADWRPPAGVSSGRTAADALREGRRLRSSPSPSSERAS